MIRGIVPSMLAGLLAASSASAQTQNQFPTQAPSQAPIQGQTQYQRPYESSTVARSTSRAVPDVLFAAAAASGGMAEVNVSEIGLQHATDPELRRFSQQMIDDRTRLNHELNQLVAQKSLSIPKTIDARAQFCADSLAGLSGSEFDKHYAKAQLVMHMDSVAMFEAEAERGVDPDMRAHAAKALPKIKEHLKTIKPIAKKYMMEEKSEASAEGRYEHSGTNRYGDLPCAAESLPFPTRREGAPQFLTAEVLTLIHELIVVGAGMGGLASAALAQRLGLRTARFETEAARLFSDGPVSARCQRPFWRLQAACASSAK